MPSTPPTPPEPYGSVRDLPSFQEMQQQLRAYKVVGVVAGRKHRREAKRLGGQLKRLATLVDSFYAVLGERNWIFTGDLMVDEMEDIVASSDSAEAERRFIEYYKQEDRIRISVMRLSRFEAMRPRMALLEKALEDYEAARYYSVVLVLIAVMDGFVNDFEKEQRRGLHTRSVGEMVAWDSVVGHHLGLSHAHISFTKNVKQTDDTPTVDLFRNGLMHGMLTNFDNDVIATKAWNRLFAVADWAAARLKQAAPVEPTPSFRELLKKLSESQQRSKLIDAWLPHGYDAASNDGASSEVVITCTAYLDQWQKRQWGLVGGHFLQVGRQAIHPSDQARTARDLYGGQNLSAWSLRRIEHTAAAVAVVQVEIVVNGMPYSVKLRWVRVDAENDTATEWEPGSWKLAPYGPTVFLEPESGDGVNPFDQG